MPVFSIYLRTKYNKNTFFSLDCLLSTIIMYIFAPHKTNITNNYNTKILKNKLNQFNKTMKKIFSLIAIAAVASTMFTSCGGDDKPDTGGKKAKLTLKVDKPALKAGEEGKFTITSDIAAPSDIAITVKSSDVAILTVDPASVTIAKDKKIIEGTYTAKANGKVTITIAASGVTLSVASANVTVGEVTPELPILLECDAENVFPLGDDPFIASENSAGFALWFNAGGVLLENTGCDYYGADLKLTAAEKGTDIATLTMVQNPDHTLMGLNSGDGYEILPAFTNIGTAQYIVFCITDGIAEAKWDDKTLLNPEDFVHTNPQLKGWALVTSTDNGTAVKLHSFKFPATKVGE